MPMKTNTVKKNLARKEPSIGSWLNLASPLAAEYMAHAGWDWLVVDTEHSVADEQLTSQPACNAEVAYNFQ